MLVAGDVYRPAAIDQLKILGEQIGVPVYTEPGNHNPVEIAENAIKHARQNNYNVVIVDTAGRLQIDETLAAVHFAQLGFFNLTCGVTGNLCKNKLSWTFVSWQIIAEIVDIVFCYDFACSALSYLDAEALKLALERFCDVLCSVGNRENSVATFGF